MIDDIQINGFRGIKSGKIKGFRQINLIVGPNNAGKSAIIEALYLANTALRQAGLIVQREKHGIDTRPIRVSAKDFLGNDPLQKVLGKHGYNLKKTQTNRMDHGVVKVKTRDKRPPLAAFDLDPGPDDSFNDEDANISLFAMDGVSALDEEKKSLIMGSEAADKVFKKNLKSSELSEQIDELRSRVEQLKEKKKNAENYEKNELTNDIVQCVEAAEQLEAYRDFVAELTGHSVSSLKDQQVVYCWHPDLTFFSKGTANWIISGEQGLGGHTLLFDMEVAGRHVSPEFYQRALAGVPGWPQRIARHFGAIFDLDPASFNALFVPIQDNGAQTHIQGWIAAQDRPALPIDTYGDGARTAFKLLAYLVALAEMATPESPGLVLWEEPESFQNPVSLARLFKQVVDIVRDKPIQLFCASHSLDVVAHLTRMLQMEEIQPDEARLFRMNMRNNELFSSWFDRDNLVAWLGSGLDPRIWGDFVPPIQFFLREDD